VPTTDLFFLIAGLIAAARLPRNIPAFPRRRQRAPIDHIIPRVPPPGDRGHSGPILRHTHWGMIKEEGDSGPLLAMPGVRQDAHRQGPDRLPLKYGETRARTIHQEMERLLLFAGAELKDGEPGSPAPGYFFFFFFFFFLFFFFFFFFFFFLLLFFFFCFFFFFFLVSRRGTEEAVATFSAEAGGGPFFSGPDSSAEPSVECAGAGR